MNDEAKEVLEGFEDAKSVRLPYESLWQELKDLVRPTVQDFNSRRSPGEVDSDKILDATPTQASEDLASGINAAITNENERWAGLKPEDKSVLSEPDVAEWVESVSDTIYSTYASSQVALHPVLHELYLDLVVFGNGVMLQERNPKTLMPRFRAIQFSDVYFMEDIGGHIDCIYRKVLYSTRQVIQKFGNMTPKKIMDDKDMGRKWEFVHCVKPNTKRDYNKYNSTNMPFSSKWVAVEDEMILKDSGFETFPYHVARWSRRAGDVYGSGPGITGLPFIRLLQTVTKTVLKAAQKVVDPPLMVPDDAFVMPIRTHPSALLMKTPGSENIEPLVTHGNIPVGMDMIESLRDAVRKSFYTDLIRATRKKERQSVLEIQDDRDEQYRLMSPMTGRIKTELLDPLIKRTYSMLVTANKIPKPPRAIHGKNLKIEYVGSSSRAQLALKAVPLQRYIQDLSLIAPAFPEIWDAIDMDKFAHELGDIRELTQRVRRTPDEILDIRTKRQQQQAMAQALDAGPKIAGAAKDLADANRPQ